MHFAIDIIERLNGINMVDGVQSPIGVFQKGGEFSVARTRGGAINFVGTPVGENSDAVIDPAQTAERNANNYFAKLENHAPEIDKLA